MLSVLSMVWRSWLTLKMQFLSIHDRQSCVWEKQVWRRSKGTITLRCSSSLVLRIIHLRMHTLILRTPSALLLHNLFPHIFRRRHIPPALLLVHLSMNIGIDSDKMWRVFATLEIELFFCLLHWLCPKKSKLRCSKQIGWTFVGDAIIQT